MSRPVKLPGPDHPITVEPSPAHVVVRRDGATIADSTATLVLREADYPPVHYIPPADVDRSALTDSDTTTYCPFKGEAAYVSTPDQADVAWYYPAPHDAVAPIADHLAFYTDRVELTVQEDG